MSISQLPDGHIRVVWSAVDGAVRYKLSRSVPPVPDAPVSLPNPSDTQYVDSDVKPGSTYYYVVLAVDEAGLAGIKATAAPVKAVEPVVATPAQPTPEVTVYLNGKTAIIEWAPRQAGKDGYSVDRAALTPQGFRGARVGNYIACCKTTDQVDAIPPGSRLSYRITAVNPNMFTKPPVSSAWIIIPEVASTDTTGGHQTGDTTVAASDTARTAADSTTATDTTRTASDTTKGPGDSTAATSSDTTSPADTRVNVHSSVVARPGRVKVGATLDLGRGSTFTGLHLQKARWLSFNEAKATVDSRGKVLGRSAGLAYIMVVGLAPDGAIASMVQRVDVARK
jgi:hypothetical protein